MQDQYLELTTSIQASSHFFGLGERIQSTGMELLKNGLPLTLWTRDQPAADPDVNNYGAHPHYLEIREGECSLPSTSFATCKYVPTAPIAMS